MLNHAMPTAVGTKMTKNKTTPNLFPDAKANGAAAPSTRADRAIMERRNQAVFDAASGCLRMIHHEPMPSASQATK